MKRFENREVKSEVKALKKFLNLKKAPNMSLKKETFMILLIPMKVNKNRFNSRKSRKDRKDKKN